MTTPRLSRSMEGVRSVRELGFLQGKQLLVRQVSVLLGRGERVIGGPEDVSAVHRVGEVFVLLRGRHAFTILPRFGIRNRVRPPPRGPAQRPRCGVGAGPAVVRAWGCGRMGPLSHGRRRAAVRLASSQPTMTATCKMP